MMETDEYFMKAVREGYRARSAYKLLQLAKSFDLFKDVKNVIDLCAAPGSWSQVISNELHGLNNFTKPENVKLKSDVLVAAVDLNPMLSVPGVIQLKGDITKISTSEKLAEIFKNEKVDLIVCDGAHDVSGMETVDFNLHLGLITACIHIILHTLKEEGSFVAKVFDTSGCDIFVRQLRIFFKEVYLAKPHSSRDESYECFVVCKNYKKLPDFDPSKLTPYLNYEYRDFSQLDGIHKLFIPFIVSANYKISQKEFIELKEKYGDVVYEKPMKNETFYHEVKNDLNDIYGYNSVNDIRLYPKPILLKIDKAGKVNLFNDLREFNREHENKNDGKLCKDLSPEVFQEKLSIDKTPDTKQEEEFLNQIESKINSEKELFDVINKRREAIEELRQLINKVNYKK